MQINSIAVTDFIEKNYFSFFSVKVKMTAIFQIFDPLVWTIHKFTSLKASKEINCLNCYKSQGSLIAYQCDITVIEICKIQT